MHYTYVISFVVLIHWAEINGAPTKGTGSSDGSQVIPGQQDSSQYSSYASPTQYLSNSFPTISTTRYNPLNQKGDSGIKPPSNPKIPIDDPSHLDSPSLNQKYAEDNDNEDPDYFAAQAFSPDRPKSESLNSPQPMLTPKDSFDMHANDDQFSQPPDPNAEKSKENLEDLSQRRLDSQPPNPNVEGTKEKLEDLPQPPLDGRPSDSNDEESNENLGDISQSPLAGDLKSDKSDESNNENSHADKSKNRKPIDVTDSENGESELKSSQINFDSDSDLSSSSIPITTINSSPMVASSISSEAPILTNSPNSKTFDETGNREDGKDNGNVLLAGHGSEGQEPEGQGSEESAKETHGQSSSEEVHAADNAQTNAQNQKSKNNTKQSGGDSHDDTEMDDTKLSTKTPVAEKPADGKDELDNTNVQPSESTEASEIKFSSTVSENSLNEISLETTENSPPQSEIDDKQTNSNNKDPLTPKVRGDINESVMNKSEKSGVGSEQYYTKSTIPGADDDQIPQTTEETSSSSGLTETKAPETVKAIPVSQPLPKTTPRNISSILTANMQSTAVPKLAKLTHTSTKVVIVTSTAPTVLLTSSTEKSNLAEKKILTTSESKTTSVEKLATISEDVLSAGTTKSSAVIPSEKMDSQETDSDNEEEHNRKRPSVSSGKGREGGSDVDDFSQESSRDKPTDDKNDKISEENAENPPSDKMPNAKDITEQTTVNGSTSGNEGIITKVTNFGKNIVHKAGAFYIGLTLILTITVLVIVCCCCCRICRRRRRGIRHKRLKEYGQEKEFLLSDRSNSSKYNHDTVTLLDGSSEDEF